MYNFLLLVYVAAVCFAMFRRARFVFALAARCFFAVGAGSFFLLQGACSVAAGWGAFLLVLLLGALFVATDFLLRGGRLRNAGAYGHAACEGRAMGGVSEDVFVCFCLYVAAGCSFFGCPRDGTHSLTHSLARCPPLFATTIRGAAGFFLLRGAGCFFAAAWRRLFLLLPRGVSFCLLLMRGTLFCCCCRARRLKPLLRGCVVFAVAVGRCCCGGRFCCCRRRPLQHKTRSLETPDAHRRRFGGGLHKTNTHHCKDLSPWTLHCSAPAKWASFENCRVRCATCVNS